MAEEDRKQSKRRREKERRQEFTEAYQQLNYLLLEVDPNREPSQQTRASKSDAASEGQTRIELIQRSIHVIRRLHEENIHLRSRIQDNDRGAEDQVRFVSMCSLALVSMYSFETRTFRSRISHIHCF